MPSKSVLGLGLKNLIFFPPLLISINQPDFIYLPALYQKVAHCLAKTALSETLMTDWVKVLIPTRHKIGLSHFGDVLFSQSVGLSSVTLSMSTGLLHGRALSAACEHGCLK